MADCILLVEDEPLVALDIELTLTDLGFEVDGPHASVASALSAIQDRTHACAVLDVRVADGDVFPLADALRDRGVGIVFHSGHADEKSLKAQYPSAAICPKPSAPSALKSSVMDVLWGSEAAHGHRKARPMNV